MTSTFEIIQAHWPKDAPALKDIREQVFVREQGVPMALEWDGKDADATHLIARNSHKQAIGTARMLSDGQIGRMAVLKDWRGRGVGSALLSRLLALAHTANTPRPYLNAQLSAIEFYVRHGFRIQGDVFMDAGIAHLAMTYQSDGADSDHPIQP